MQCSFGSSVATVLVLCAHTPGVGWILGCIGQDQCAPSCICKSPVSLAALFPLSPFSLFVSLFISTQYMVVVVVSAITDIIALAVNFQGVTSTPIGTFSFMYPSIFVDDPIHCNGGTLLCVQLVIDLLFILSLVSQCGAHEFNRKGEICSVWFFERSS